MKNLYTITPAENRVLVLCAEGLTNGEIANRLHVSRKTVETHMSSMLGKCCAKNRWQLVQQFRDREIGSMAHEEDRIKIEQLTAENQRLRRIISKAQNLLSID